MKKPILSLLLIFITLSAFAQLPTIGIKGGVNFATLSASGQANNVVAGTNLQASSGSVTSFNFGVFADIKFGHLSLQPAVNFTGKGGTFDGTTGPLPGGSTSQVHSKYNLYYVQVPVNIVYHIPVVIGEIYLGAGPYGSYGVHGKLKQSAINTQNGSFSSSRDIKFGDESGEIKRMDYGANAIAGIKLKGGLLFNINYDLGLTNILPDADGNKMKTRVLGASVGFAF
ncbi:porin family protein [Mucilaginibacter celer]|uniref:PorT family protein n=1 Tax=Mucilaginibacter celer TaxID=2305508 RepID=A0A494VNT0_9SPHI|nr:porin family protein [Mucilaginibacter celer]AYL94710.1 PorT family protein [Mucilaginibacter celer]